MITMRCPLSKTNTVELSFLNPATVADIEMLCKYLELTKIALTDDPVDSYGIPPLPNLEKGLKGT